MNISDVELYRIGVPAGEPARAANSLLVRLVVDSDDEGWGEASIDWRAEELEPRRQALVAMLTGRSPFDIEEMRRLDGLSPAPLRAAVEMACWDLVGRAAGQPLCNLLGGVYRSRVPVAAPLAPGPPESYATQSRELLEQAFVVQTLGSSQSMDDDFQNVASLREATGSRIELRLDGRNAYTLDDARELCKALEPSGLEYLLDPLEQSDFARLASLERETDVPLAVSRSIASSRDLMAMARAGAARHVLIDIERVGGLTESRRCAAVAEAARISALLGPGYGVGVGLAALLHVAASHPQFSSANPCTYHQLSEDVLVEPLELVDGMLGVPQGPGLGVEVDRAKLERFAVTTE